MNFGILFADIRIGCKMQLSDTSQGFVKALGGLETGKSMNEFNISIYVGFRKLTVIY